MLRWLSKSTAEKNTKYYCIISWWNQLPVSYNYFVVESITLTLTLTQTALSRCCYGRWGTAESPTHSPATRLHVL